MVTGRAPIPVHAVSTDGANRISLSERTKCEFDFEVMNNWGFDTFLETPELAGAMKDYGGFPLRYYVRLEETMVFTHCQEFFAKDDNKRKRIAIVGSPGVGKSVFLVLFAFYLAHVKSKSVIILRWLKEPFTFACVHVCREGYSGANFSKPTDFQGIRDQHAQSLFFFDGFTPGTCWRLPHNISSGVTILPP